jgi:menaquinone-9 beta-reductase
MAAHMAVRATKRGDERTPLTGDWDVLVCGASFAGLAVARELHGSGARVLIVDRYEIGERQTSACAAPTEWIDNLGLSASVKQTFGELVVHRPDGRFEWPLPWTYSTFDYRQFCALLFAQTDATFETAKVEGRTVGDDGRITVHTDRGDLTAPLVVDALGWRRVLGSGKNIQPPNARLSRGLEVHPAGRGEHLELFIDPDCIRAGYGWSFPADDELRIGVGSFDPHDHVKDPTVKLADDLGPGIGEHDGASTYQGNWIPHQMRDAVDEHDPIFFAGDSAGHCYPTTAEGIRPALYYALALGRELRAVHEGRQVRAQALQRYAEFCEQDRWAFAWLLRVQHTVGRINALPLMTTVLQLFGLLRMSRWSFQQYLELSPPEYVLSSPAYPGGLAGTAAAVPEAAGDEDVAADPEPALA